MIDRENDINDDEIRIIRSHYPRRRVPQSEAPQSDSSAEKGSRRPNPTQYCPLNKEEKTEKGNGGCCLIAILIAVVIGVAAAFVFSSRDEEEQAATDSLYNMVETVEGGEYTNPDGGSVGEPETYGFTSGPIPYTTSRDTTVSDVPLNILTPHNARAALARGPQVLDNPSVILAIQAADIRADNLEIACAYVEKGELISKGEAKAGFCAIINGKMTIGIAEATPKFEEVLNSNGYFFRQYPLVIAGQAVDNKPKGKAIRKALADINGTICIISSRIPLTYHDFSRVLADFGVDNAISLVGSNSSGVYLNGEDGERHIFGDTPPAEWSKSINYLYWYHD